jgi:hypothetical protein
MDPVLQRDGSIHRILQIRQPRSQLSLEITLVSFNTETGACVN